MTTTTSTPAQSTPAQGLSEAAWEDFALDQLGEPLGWRPLAGEKIAPGTGERESWSELLIRPRLLDALLTLNPTVPVAEPVVTYPLPSVSTLRYARTIKLQPLCLWHGLAFF